MILREEFMEVLVNDKLAMQGESGVNLSDPPGYLLGPIRQMRENADPVADQLVALVEKRGIPAEKPGIIGRDRALVDKVAKLVHDATKKQHQWTPLRETRRGSWFEVRVTGPEGPTKHIVSITIELDRLEELDGDLS
jgi:hypothetical protein